MDAGDRDEDPVWRLRWWLLLSTAVCFASMGVLTVDVPHHHWRTAWLMWGVALGFAGVVVLSAVVWIATGTEETPPEARSRHRRNLWVRAGSWLFAATLAGWLAAVTGWGWIDIGLAAYVALFVLLTPILYVYARRHLARAEES